MPRLLKAVVVFGILNAAAYSCLLPLWEGFDEGFHFGYVQSLATSGSFPVLGKTNLSKEVWHSYELVPVSQYLQAYTRAPVNFSDYFATTEEQRKERRHQLETLPAGEKFEPQPDKPNYEVNQAPLPYLFMAIVHRALSGSSLPTRVLWLRLICSALAAVLLSHATVLMAREISLPDFEVCAVLFCTFSSQMLLAVISHVSNDCFAVPAMGYLIWTSMRAARTGSPGDFLRLSVALATALLTKAYFLFLIPLPLGIVAWTLFQRRLSLKAGAWFVLPQLLLVGPWYLRNVILYNNLSATVESTSGLGLRKAASAAFELPWLESIRYMAHSSLWTGNNSFTTFSSATLNLVLLLLGAGVVLYTLRARPDPAELTLATAVVLFCCGVAVISVAFFASSKGAVNSAVPWYQQVLLMPILLIVFLGLHRWKRVGTVGGAAFVLVWTYLLLATYWVKLVPLYGGFPQGRTQLRPLIQWYLHQSAARDSILRWLCLAPLSLLWTLIISTSLATIVLCGVLLLKALRGQIA